MVTAGQLSSGEQSEVLADLGVPEVFAVHELAVDGEIDGVVRLERWGYPDLGRMVVFIDGVRAAEGPLPMPGAGWPQSPDRSVDWTLLHHDLSAEERNDLPGPPADRLPASRTQGVAPWTRTWSCVTPGGPSLLVACAGPHHQHLGPRGRSATRAAVRAATSAS